MKRKSSDDSKGARSKVRHQTNGIGQTDMAALIKERNELRKRVAELRQEKSVLLASIASTLFKPTKINKKEMLKQAKSRPTMQELIAELKQLGS